MSNPLANMAHISDVLASTLHEVATVGAHDREFLKRHPGKGHSTVMYGMPRLLGRAEAMGIPASGLDPIAEKAVFQFKKGSRLCESPIERSMLAALVTGDWGDMGAVPPVVHDATKGSKENMPLAPVVIVPQLAFVRMRLDFGVVVIKDRRRQIVAIECDGKQFHQDAVKESDRVAYLRSWDIPTFKFTGSELHDDAINAADRVIAGIHGWWLS